MPRPTRTRKRHPPAVARLVSKRRDEIEELCEVCKVQQLYLFGSAASGEFRSRTSDLDFLVRFKPSTPAEHADRYFRLIDGLKDIFHRRIDLVEIEAVNNPYFRQSAESNRVLLYEA
jgi:predicted nucleotidyltransferase